MKGLAVRWLMLASLVGIGAACSPAGGGTAGTGGNVGTGGVAAGTGGRIGTGGSSTGTGGTGTGTGGTGPMDAGTTSTAITHTFDTSAEGFILNTYVAAAGTTNLAAPDSGSAPAVSFDATGGNPIPGSLRLTATFTGYKQLVDVVLFPNPAINLTGKTLHAKVRLVSGTFTGGAILHVGTTPTFAYGAGAYTTLGDGTWKDLTFDLSTGTSTGWNASMVTQIGIQFYSGDPPATGVFGAPVDAVFQIDSVTDGAVPLAGADGGVPSGLSYTFDTFAQTFSYNPFVPAAGTTNLAAPGSGSTPTLGFDNAVGNPNPGSLKASVTFTGYAQFVDVVISPSPVFNGLGKTLHAKVMLTSGTFAGGAILHASTTPAYIYGGGPFTPLVFGAWTDLTFDLSTGTAASWDPTMVTQIGIQFYTGNPPEAGAFAGPNTVVFNIDTITE